VKLIPDVARTAEKDWDRDAGEIEREQLAQVRGVAAKWSATVTAVLGVFGVAALVEGAEEIRKLETWAGAVIALLGLLAAVAGLVALVATGLAARGLPRHFDYVSGASLRLEARREARSALARVRRGVWATVIAALLVIAAFGLLLSAPEKPDEVESLRVETRSGTVLCGKQRDALPGQVAVEPATGGRSDPIPLGDVQSVKAVTEC